MADNVRIEIEVPENYEAWESIEDIMVDWDEPTLILAAKRYCRTQEQYKKYRVKSSSKAAAMKEIIEANAELKKQLEAKMKKA